MIIRKVELISANFSLSPTLTPSLPHLPLSFSLSLLSISLFTSTSLPHLTFFSLFPLSSLSQFLSDTPHTHKHAQTHTHFFSAIVNHWTMCEIMKPYFLCLSNQCCFNFYPQKSVTLFNFCLNYLKKLSNEEKVLKYNQGQV